MDLLSLLKHLLFLPALFAWWRVGPLRPRWAQWAGVQLLASIAMEVIGLSTRLQGINNQWMYNVYLVVEFTTLCAMILCLAPDRNRALVRTVVGGVVYAVAVVVNVRSNGSVRVFASQALLVGGLVLALLALVVMYRLADTSTVRLARLPAFWMLLSVMLYFLCIIPVFGLHNHFAARNPQLARLIYPMNDVLFMLRYGLFAWSMVLLRGTLIPRHR
jgi:hypothetical protein